MMPLLVVPIAYLLGAIPFGYLLVRMTTGEDVRSSGSGNIGATNVLRTTGRIAAIATLLLDIAKGYFAVWLAGRMTDESAFWMSLAALAVMAGHAYPVFLKFRGGKAVASLVGAFACLTPWAMLAVVPIFVVTVAWTGHISMGSIVGAAVLPLAVWLMMQPPMIVFVASVVAGLFIIWRHGENIARLRQGTENRFRFGSPKR